MIDMKFSNGFWLNKAGVALHPAQAAFEVGSPDGKGLRLLVPCHPIHTRGDTLGGVTMTVELSSPAPDIIRVRSRHYAGVIDTGPHFECREDTFFSPQIEEDDGEVRLTAGALQVRVSRAGGWRMDFYQDGKKLTSSSGKGFAYIVDECGRPFVRDQLELDVGECVYGLGERFTPFVKNGQAIDITNEDGGTCSEQAYKNIPFYITSGGYGVFVNHAETVSFEVASEVVSRVGFSVPGESLDYYVIAGPEPKKVLERYTWLTGRPALPPKWSFGLWLSTSFTTDYDEKTVTSFVNGMRERGIPLDVFHFDCFWMREFRWCDFTWDARVFPDPKGMLARLKALGLHICVWINPYIGQESALFKEAAENGFLLRRTNGDVWQWDMWQSGMGVVDFTNPAARAWFTSKLDALQDMGVDSFKTDFGERIPREDVVWFDGSDPEKMHNYYAFLYNQTVTEALAGQRGKEDAVVFARAATTGSQQFPVHWGGDSTANYPSMAETLRGGLSLGLCGFGFWSHDIGGFEATASPDVYKRWVAFGLLSSHSRLHGSTSYRVPWNFDEEAVDVLRFFAKLKYRLMPYLFGAAEEAAATGVPVLRAMLLEFPRDPACRPLDTQYMLGDALLVAPIFSETGDVTYYLPEGRWVSLIDGSVKQGGRFITERHGYKSLPLMMRPNRMIALGKGDSTADYDYADGATLLLSPLDDGMAADCCVGGKLCAAAKREGARVIVEVKAERPWSLKVLGMSVQSAAGVKLERQPDGVALIPEASAMARPSRGAAKSEAELPTIIVIELV